MAERKRTFSPITLALLGTILLLFGAAFIWLGGTAYHYEMLKRKDTLDPIMKRLASAKKAYAKQPTFGRAMSVIDEAYDLRMQANSTDEIVSTLVNGSYKVESKKVFAEYMPLVKKHAKKRDQKFEAVHLAKQIGYEVPFPELLPEYSAWKVADYKRRGIGSAPVVIGKMRSDSLPPPPGWKPQLQPWWERIGSQLPR